MPPPVIDFPTYLKRIPQHTTDLHEEASVPLRHYRRTANDAWNLRLYVERNIPPGSVYPIVLDGHLHQLSNMVLLTCVEAFERFLKELAAGCIDQVAQLVLDDRLDAFKIGGTSVALHFEAHTVGRCLCESLSWCDCAQANERFRKILADPFDRGSFYVFPGPSQNPAALRDRIDLVELLWQLRHSIAHNAGMITSSESLRYRLLTRQPVDAPRRLWPNRGDVWYVKLYLDESAELINRHVAERLAILLSDLYASDATLFQPDAKAQELADFFQVPITVSGHTRNPL